MCGGRGGRDEEGMITCCNFVCTFVVALLCTLYALYLVTRGNKISPSSSLAVFTCSVDRIRFNGTRRFQGRYSLVGNSSFALDG